MYKKTKYDTLTEVYQNELVKNLANLVAIDSTYDKSTVSELNPFGEGVSKALNYIADMAKKDGFQVRNINNMVVEILVGSGDKNITIMAHADVVPAGTGWNQNPFEMVDKGEILCGRGVADDKGPMLASYYALKALRDNNLLGNYQVRFLVGGNEESGSRGIEYYFEHNKTQPTFGFSPDAEFPLIYAEKGIVNFDVSNNFKREQVISIDGGVASNSVIEKCVVTMKKDNSFKDYLLKNNVEFVLQSEDETSMVIEFRGVAAHGATPELGVNAGMIAVTRLGEFYNIDEFKQISKCYSDLYGRGVNAYSYSENMRENSLNVGIIKYENNQFNMIVNFRYVETADLDELLKNIAESSKPFDIKVVATSKLLFFPKESTLVSTLLKAYQDETGDMESKPMAIGGGTYAKEADNVVAFGMDMPGWDSHMHSPGEQVRKQDLFKAMSIYANAIIELGNKINEN